ncbi:MAG: CRISPR-associated endoribonuclease Cas6 [Bacteroidales bacterium]|nr:CRISPR-associated endoribonuclease Cas6 [Bacteroidales bacterium]
MRFRLSLSIVKKKLNGAKLPLNYQYELSSWMYRLINLSDPVFSSWLHDTGYSMDNRKFKMFTFSNLKPGRYTINGDRMEILSDETELLVSFCLPQAVEHFITGLFRNQQFQLGDKTSNVCFSVTSIEKLPDIVFADTMRFSTLSPLVISRYDKSGSKYAQYISPADKEFPELLIKNLLAKYTVIASLDGSPFNTSDAVKDVFTSFKLASEPRQKLIKIKEGTAQQTFLKGYMFRFALSAPANLMYIGYYAGFGEKNSLGFGCCEVIKT